MIIPIRRQRVSENPPLPRNLSRHQYGMLKFISEHHVTLAHLRRAHGNTLGSVAYWRWVEVQGTADDAPVVLTKAGRQELEFYNLAEMNQRTHEGDITDRCLRLLKHARRLQSMKAS